MFYTNLPSKVITSRSILLHVRFHKRLLQMSLMKPSEERERSSCRLQISEDRSAAASCDLTTAKTLTEQEMTIHRVHREACEVPPTAAKTPTSSMSTSVSQINYNCHEKHQFYLSFSLYTSLFILVIITYGQILSFTSITFRKKCTSSFTTLYL